MSKPNVPRFHDPAESSPRNARLQDIALYEMENNTTVEDVEGVLAEVEEKEEEDKEEK